MYLEDLCVRPVHRSEERRYQELMQAHHYLGALPKIGETLWYIASYRGEWVALLSFSAAAWKCAVRDRWIGWSYRHQYDRLKLLANNSRFLILPNWHRPNLGSKALSLCERRLQGDWWERFGHPVVLLETFVDSRRFRGTVYRAANWIELGQTRSFRRTRGGYSETANAPKKVFVKRLQPDACAVLARPHIPSCYHTGVPKLMLTADQMVSLPQCFADIPDPRRAQGRRHPLPVVLSLAAGAILCGMRGYKILLSRSSDMKSWIELFPGFKDAEGDMQKLTHHGADDEFGRFARESQPILELLTPGHYCPEISG